MIDESKNLLAVDAGDGFDDTDNDSRVIQGTIIKCNDGYWQDRDLLAIPSGMQLLVLATTTIVQRWKDQRPIDTIMKQPGQPLPSVAELNAKIPEAEWELGLDGKPRPPWQRQQVVYLLDKATAQKFTFASGTIGARIAVENLRDQVKWMRALRGANVVPIVELDNAPMRTRFGSKLRPAFKILQWVELGITHEAMPQIESAPLAQQTIEQAGQLTAAPPAPAERPTPAKIPSKNIPGLKPVTPVSTKEALDDEIKF